MTDFNTLTKAYADAAATLCEALIDDLKRKDPALYAKVEQGLNQGQRLMLALEFALEDSAIRLVTVDDYQRVKRIMEVRGMPGRRH